MDTRAAAPAWTVATVEHDGTAVHVELERGAGERRHVELTAGVLAVLGSLPRRFDGAPLPPAGADMGLDEWGRPR